MACPQLAGIPVEDRMRRTPAAAPTRAGGSGGEDGSGSDEAGGCAPAKERVPPTHSLWMLSRKFVRLLLTRQVRDIAALRRVASHRAHISHLG